MHVAVYCSFLASALLGVLSPALARRLPPATATRLLVTGAVVAAASSLLAVSVLALTWAGRLPVVAALGRWSPAALAASSPVPPAVGIAASGCLLAVVMRGVRVVLVHLSAVHAARALCRQLGGAAGQLIVVDDDLAPVAVPVAGGRILASSAHLAALPAAERRALLLHERAHLADHHSGYRLVAALAGAVDPLQHRVRPAVTYATERWADEVAAARLGDRAAVARALARSQLLAAGRRSGGRWAAVALSVHGGDTVRRVRALLAPAPRQRPAAVLAVAAVAVCALTVALHAQEDSERYFEPATGVAAQGHTTPGRG